MNVNARNLSGILGTKDDVKWNVSGISSKMDTKIAFDKAEKQVTIQDTYQNQIDEINSKKDVTLQRIMNKFYAGKKLTAAELSYLAKHSPEYYSKVAQVMRKREQLERQMEMAKTKEEVDDAYANALSGIQGSIGKTGESSQPSFVLGAINQMADEYHQYVNSSGYKRRHNVALNVMDSHEQEDEEDEEDQRRGIRNEKSRVNVTI